MHTQALVPHKVAVIFTCDQSLSGGPQPCQLLRQPVLLIYKQDMTSTYGTFHTSNNLRWSQMPSSHDAIDRRLR